LTGREHQELPFRVKDRLAIKRGEGMPSEQALFVINREKKGWSQGPPRENGLFDRPRRVDKGTSASELKEAEEIKKKEEE